MDWVEVHSRVRFWLALLAVTVLPALIVIALYDRGSQTMGDGYGWIRTRNFAILALLVSGGHVLVLGLPAFLSLKHLKMIRWWSSIVAGVLLGGGPAEIFTWPMRSSKSDASAGYWHAGKMVQTMVSGVPTAAGWIQYAESVGYLGMYGAIGGIAFWLVWRRGDPKESNDG
jgi:hypothetical protein